jgi:hypothetical protein
VSEPTKSEPTKYELALPQLEDLARDPRAMLRTMGDLALGCFNSAQEEFSHADQINRLILDTYAPPTRRYKKDVNVIATDILDVTSKKGGERLRRLRDLYTIRNQVLANARKAAREGVFIMGQAAAQAEFVKRIILASQTEPEPPLPPETQAVLDTAAARIHRLGVRRAHREAQALREREAEVTATMPTEELPPDEEDS